MRPDNRVILTAPPPARQSGAPGPLPTQPKNFNNNAVTRKLLSEEIHFNGGITSFDHIR